MADQVVLDPSTGKYVLVGNNDTRKTGGPSFGTMAGSLLFGGGAGAAAYYLWKDPANQSVFEKTLRNGGDFHFTSDLDSTETKVLDTAKKSTNIFDKIENMFGKNDEISLNDYYRKRGIFGNTAKTIKNDISNAEKILDPKKKDSLLKKLDAADKRMTQIGALKEQSDALNDLDKQISDINKQISKLVKDDGITLIDEKNKSLFDSLNRELKGPKGTTGLNAQRKKAVEKLKELFNNKKNAGLINLQEITQDGKATKGKPFFEKLEDLFENTDGKRENFFKKVLGLEEKSKSTITNEIEKAQKLLAGRNFDLDIFNAAKENGLKTISKQTVIEAGQKIGESFKLGTKEIGEAFSKLKGKLPTGNNLVRAGIVGGVVALGLMLFSSANSKNNC